jgi:general secretion pathway protein D
MVFLRPVVMRTQQAATKLSTERCETIRGLQTRTQPTPRAMLPVNESPVLPEQASPPPDHERTSPRP